MRPPRRIDWNLDYREAALGRLQDHPEERQAARLECQSDILFWINTFVMQYNPQKRGDEVGPFATWEFQDEAILKVVDHIERGQDLVIEKSREMGASWICLIVMLWYWLFHPWKKFLFISRDADTVDRKDDSDALFWKVDFILRHLPDWMVPRYSRPGMVITNKENGSSITGEASTAKAGVGGRATAIFCDEFSQMRDAFDILHRTSDTSRCRIFNFTHTSLNNAAYYLTRQAHIDKLVMHWTSHPLKMRGMYRYDPEIHTIQSLDPRFQFPRNFQFIMDGTPTGGPFPGIRSPWYDKECLRKGSGRAVAMDLDINAEGSTSQFFDPLLIQQLIRDTVSEPVLRGDLLYDEETAQPRGFKERLDGPFKLWMQLDPSGKPRKAPYFFGADVSAGSGATPTCFTIFDGELGEKVLEYDNPHIKAHQAAALAVAVCRFFHNARMVWEGHGPGNTFGQVVIELNYGNYWMREDELRLDKKIAEGGKVGWSPTPVLKRLLLESYHEALRLRFFVNHSREALRECLSFHYDPQGNPVHGKEKAQEESAARVNHGDHVIADALAWMLGKTGSVSLQARAKRKPEGPPLLSLAWRHQYAENMARRASGDEQSSPPELREGEQPVLTWRQRMNS